MEIQRNIEKSSNISTKIQNALLTILNIKANMSLTILQERQEIEQFMKSLDRTDRIRLHILLRQALLQQQRYRRSIHKINKSVSDEEESDEISDEISNENEQLISCKFHCNSTNQCNIERLNLNIATKDDLMRVMKNCMGEDERDVVSLI